MTRKKSKLSLKRAVAMVKEASAEKQRDLVDQMAANQKLAKIKQDMLFDEIKEHLTQK